MMYIYYVSKGLYLFNSSYFKRCRYAVHSGILVKSNFYSSGGKINETLLLLSLWKWVYLSHFE